MANRFWVAGGDGLWSSTTNWSATSGGGSGASVPGSADTATFNASSGAGIATVDSSVTIQTLTLTGFTGTLAFGTNSISLNSTGLIFTGAATCSITGTPVINVTNATATATTVNVTAMTEANSISFNFTGGTYPLTIGNSSAFKNLNFVSSGTTGFGGTLLAHNSSDFTIFGNLTLSSNMTHPASSLGYLFAATSGTQIVTSNGKTFDMPMALTGVGGTTKLADAFAMGATRTFNFNNGNFDGNGQTITGALLLSASAGGVTSFKGLNTARPFTVTNSTTTFTGNNTTGVFVFTTGTLDLGSYTLTALSFNSSNGNTRTLNFNASTINVTNTAGGTLWTTATTTGLTVAGTPIVNISNSGAVATSVLSGNLTEASAISFNFVNGTYALTFLGTVNYTAKNVNFSGFAGTWNARTVASTIYGNLTLSSAAGFSMAASTGVITFGATSGVQIFTSNGKTFDGPITVNGVGGTIRFADALTMGSTRSLALANGTLNVNGQTLTAGSVNVSGTTARTVAFGAGNITCLNSGTAWNATDVTNLTITGTPIVNISNSGAVATSVIAGTLPESSAISFNITAGTYVLSMLNGAGATAKSIDLTGFQGTWGATSSGVIYGGLTLPAAPAVITTSVTAMTFGATSGSYNIKSNGQTVDFPITFNGAGGTWKFTDAFTLGSTRNMTLTNGTLDLNGQAVTVSNSFVTATGTKNLTFNGGTLVCAGTTLAFSNAQPLNFSTTAGTGTGKISMTNAALKSFSGGGSTFNCTLSNDGAGALSISGSNTFTTIANSVQPTSFTFTSGTTTTITNWNISGTAGNLVTITSSSGGTAATLSKASGAVYAYYVSLKDSAATGGASWYAAIGSTNVSGNSGWIFGAAKYWVGGTGNWSTAARWALSTGGAGGFGITPADAAVFDSSSGGGTSTVDSNVSVQTLTMTGYTGTLAFGTNTISLTSEIASTVIFTGDSTHSVSGTPVINITNSTSNALTVTTSASTTEANSISFNFISGTYTLTITSQSRVRDINFTGWSGTLSSIVLYIFGDTTLSSTGTFPTNSSSWVFASTNATPRTITSNGKTFDRPTNFDGIGGTWQLADAYTTGTSRTITHTNGTLNLNGKTMTAGFSYRTATGGTKVLTFNGGTLAIQGTGTTTFNNAAPANFSTVAGTGVGKISLNSASAKTFVGAGSTYNCTLSNDGIGALTISGSNTFTTIANGVQPTTFTFTAGTTQTLTNWSVSGAAGNPVTINSSAAGTAASLSKASGTVSADYLSIQDSSATGGAAWYAGASSTNVSGNSGWIFSAPPVVTAGGNFFFMF